MTLFSANDLGANGRDSGRTRRQVLGSALAVSAAALLPACGSGGQASGGSDGTSAIGAGHMGGLSALPGGTPVRGGRFTMGCISGGASETLWPNLPISNPDFFRLFSLFSFLFYPGVANTPVLPGLALSAESNRDATVWTFHLRDGVEWHDGKSFGADDVVYNFKVPWASAQLSAAGSFLVGLVDFGRVRKRSRLIVEVPLLYPVADFSVLFADFEFPIVQEGATPKSTQRLPIGTGAFKYKSFTPGSRSVFVANKNFWEEGKPYVDELVVESSFTAPQPMVNAMLAGDINLLPAIPFVSARQQLSAKQMQILVSQYPTQTYEMVMRCDTDLFQDPRVRLGFKYMIDRQAVIDQAFAGFGTVNYDLVAPYTEHYATDLKREQDVEHAKALFKAAGATGKTFPWPTTNSIPGLVDMVTVVASQAPAAGIKVQPEVQSAATYFTPAAGFTTRPAGIDYNQPLPSLMAEAHSQLLPGCANQETRWWSQPGGAAGVKVIKEAISATDKSRAQMLWHAAQEEQFNKGGYLVLGNVPYVDAAANNVRGLTSGAGLNYNNVRLQDGWFA